MKLRDSHKLILILATILFLSTHPVIASEQVDFDADGAPSTVESGESFTINYTLTNTGTQDITAAGIRVDVPEEFTVEDATGDGSKSLDRESPTVFYIDRIPPGSSVSTEFTYRVNDDTQATTTEISAKAAITINSTDVVEYQNTSIQIDSSSEQGVITGIITDENNSEIDGQVVNYEVIDTNTDDTVVRGSTSDGRYTTYVPPGNYRIRAYSEGYESGSTAAYEVEAGMTTTANIILINILGSSTATTSQTETTSTTGEEVTEITQGETQTSTPSTIETTTTTQESEFANELDLIIGGLAILGLGGGGALLWSKRREEDDFGDGPAGKGAGVPSTPDEPTGKPGSAGDSSAAKPSGTATPQYRDAAISVPPDTPTHPDLSMNYNDLANKEIIGSGGNAQVFRAEYPVEGQSVTLAIKEPRISGTLHKEAVERLMDEAETWDKLDDHENIVGIVDYGSEPLPWIGMEYMDGGHLGTYAGEMDMPQALWTAIQISEGVRHAHRKGVAHLDLKPENVLFRQIDDAWNVPKVADWGLSKHLLDHSQSIEGYTPKYAAPEQLDDGFGETDDITDVYQLGAVFYELFTGQPPFDGDNTGKIIRSVLDEQPDPPAETDTMPQQVEDILLKALEKDREKRYESVLLLRIALQEVFTDLTSED